MTGPARARAAIVATVALALVATSCSSGSGNDAASRTQATAPRTSIATTAPATTSAGDPCASPSTTVSGPAGESVFAPVDFATALAWAPDGRLFVAERAGTIATVRDGQATTFATVPTVTTERGGGYSERGLLGLALSPTFARDHFVYAFYSRNDYSTQVVVRYTDCAGVASEPTTILTFPSGPDCCHKGGRLRFGPDGDLYVTLGEEHSVTAGAVGDPSSIPQDPTDPRGKVLRFRPDGSIPPDNPFGPASPAYVTGVRNPFGIAFGPGGDLFVTVNGPTGEIGAPAHGFDTASVATAGARYQWPACYGYSHPVPGAPSSCLDRTEPDWSSESDTIVPTGATWVDARGPAPYAGHFVFCSALGGMQVFQPGRPHASVTQGPDDCRYDVAQGPDGALYFSDEGAIHRLAVAKS